MFRKILGVLLGLYLLCMVVLFVAQRSLFYFPSPSYVSLHDAGANSAYRELTVRTEDGIDVKAWYAQATSKPYTFVFFHGNADNLAAAAHIGDPYIAAGYGFMVAEYRGYSGLAGSPSERGLYADGRAEIKGLLAQGVKSENIILFGHSLGTGVACQMGTEFPVRGVILLAPYLSIADLGQIIFPYFPAKLLVRDRFDNAKKIASIHAPILIVNGSRDEVIPPVQGERLFEFAHQPKEFLSLPGHGHNDLFADFARSFTCNVASVECKPFDHPWWNEMGE